MIKLLVTAALLASCFVQRSTGHPGEQHNVLAIKHGMLKRDRIASEWKRSLESCQHSSEASALTERAISRRVATAEELRTEQRLSKGTHHDRRDLEDFLAYEKVRHNMTGKYHFGPHTPENIIFGSNASCVLTPENIGGPYYVSGEQIRSNVVEDQQGVPMFLEIQFIDVATCKPATNLFVEIWACNATGVYSGVEGGEGGLNTTFLRGVQKTDHDGVTKFKTIFPGHYSGRANHQHVISHSHAKVLPNGTFTGGHVSHIGQLFFDEKLIKAIEKTHPYNLNSITRTSNDYDMWNAASATADYDPFPDYIMLGDTLQDGLFVWKTIGVNVSADWTFVLPNAAYLAADGGHENPDFVFPPTGVPAIPNTVTGPPETSTAP